MKNLLLIILVTMCCSVALAFPVRIQSWNIDRDVKTINKLNISIDSVNRTDGSIIAYMRDNWEYNKLLAEGFDAIRIPDLAREQYEYLLNRESNDDPADNQYYSFAEYQNFMQNIAAEYPEICSLHQFGLSGQNRPLYFMKISDNVNQNEAEPEIKLIGSIHGDETVGFVMLTRLIQLLTGQYNSDPRITNIVNNTELWIAPLMNPDGYVNGERYNAAGIDLNRNFPMPNGITNPDGNATAIENTAMIDFSNQHNFAIGINFHGGALVINYPWDYTYALTPDDAMIRDISLTYSSHNLPMFNSTEFPQGITNGAAWYVITGSMQDWNYGFTSNIELTAEISNNKWPPASTLNTFWDENRESILSFIEYGQKGVKGIVTSQAGTALDARITVAGTGKEIRNDPVVGDFHRILLPGNYTLSASATGYIPQSVNLTVAPNGYVFTNIVLDQAQILSFTGIVRDADGDPVANASINLDSEPPYIATSSADGIFSFPNLYEGDYQITVTSETHPPYSGQVCIRRNEGGYHLAIVLGETLFFEDFEANLDAWVPTSPWGRIQDAGNWVLTDSPSGNYGNNVNRAIRTQDPVSLAGIQNPSLSFRARWDLEAGYDYVYVEGSTNGIAWNTITSFTGTQNSWTDQLFPLDAYAEQNFYLRFRIRSDWSQTADGIYIDDVRIAGRNQGTPLWGDATGDGIIDTADIRAILEHSTGNYLEEQHLPAANVDGVAGVEAIDAYQVLLYTQDPQFGFPVQTQEALTLPELTLSAVLQENLLKLNCPIQLSCLQLSIPFVIEAINILPTENQMIHSSNAGDSLFSLLNYEPATHAEIYIHLQAPSASFSIPALVNGHSVSIGVNTSDNGDNANPALQFSLKQNHPNPFNPETGISFTLPESGHTSLKVFNMKGQLVKTLCYGNLESGEHSMIWDGSDTIGSKVSSGIYFYRLKSREKTLTKKMVLSK